MTDSTSCSDNYEYPGFCFKAATDENTFRVFRRSQEYTKIVETVSCKDGKEYLKIAFRQKPALKQYIDKFASSEILGDPQVFPYRINCLSPKILFSPTTLRYIKVLSDLMIFFGSLDGMKIVEIGGGYGGQCKIIKDVFDIKQYTIIDLLPCIRLSQRYLSSLKVKDVNYKTGEDLANELELELECDLIISNYAFSEIRRDIQDFYLEKIIKKAPRGYMLCNFKTHTWDSQQYSELELLSKLNGVKVIKSKAKLSKLDASCEIALLVWGHSLDKQKS